MRLFSVGALALMLVAFALVYFVFFALSDAHVASLVPEEMAFGVFYSSVDDVREAYEHPLSRRDVDAGRLRLGNRVNVPELNGIAQHRPFGSYMTAGYEEVLLVPYTDFDAFEDAFEVSQVDVNLRAPHRASSNYLSVSRSARQATRGKDNALVLRGLEHPISLVGKPTDAKTVRLMLQYLLAFEAPRKASNTVTLAQMVARIPTGAMARIATECDDLVLGFPKVESPQHPVRAVVDATLSGASVLRRAKSDLDLAGLVKCFPQETALLVGAALDADGWKDVGLPFDAGDAAIACGVLDTKYRARRYTLLLAVRGGKVPYGDGLSFKSMKDKDTAVQTAELPGPPAGLEMLLRVNVKQKEPPVYLSRATEAGITFVAVGAQAEQAVRHALACLRGAEELSVARSTLIGDHKDCVRGDHVAIAMVSAEGLKAFRIPMPVFEIVSLGQPGGITLTLGVNGDKLEGEMRLRRTPAARQPFKVGDGDGGVYREK